VSISGPDIVWQAPGAGWSQPSGQPNSAGRAHRRNQPPLSPRQQHLYVNGDDPWSGLQVAEEAGIEDSPGLFVSDVMNKTHGQGDERLAHAWAGQRLACGVAGGRHWSPDRARDRLSLPRALRGPMSHRAWPSRLHPARPSHRAGKTVRTHRHADAGLLGGCGARHGRGRRGSSRGVAGRDRESIQTRHVLMATNGYGADRSMVAATCQRSPPPSTRKREFAWGCASHRHVAGRCQRFSRRLPKASCTCQTCRDPRRLGTVMHGGIMVDLTGRRFGDETRDIRSTPQRSPPDQRPRAGSSSIRGFTTCGSRSTTSHRLSRAGSLVWAETIESLAEATRLDADALKAELITVTAAR